MLNEVSVDVGCVRDIDYDVVSAIVSELKMSQDETYNVVGEDSSKATSTNLRGNGLSGKETPYNKLDRENVTEGPYAVVTTNKLVCITVLCWSSM